MASGRLYVKPQNRIKEFKKSTRYAFVYVCMYRGNAVGWVVVFHFHEMSIKFQKFTFAYFFVLAFDVGCVVAVERDICV